MAKHGSPAFSIFPLPGCLPEQSLRQQRKFGVSTRWLVFARAELCHIVRIENGEMVMTNFWINDFPSENGLFRGGEGDLPAEGLEPTRSCDHWILSPARLPVPPRRLRKIGVANYGLVPALQPNIRKIDNEELVFVHCRGGRVGRSLRFCRRHACRYSVGIKQLRLRQPLHELQ